MLLKTAKNKVIAGAIGLTFIGICAVTAFAVCTSLSNNNSSNTSTSVKGVSEIKSNLGKPQINQTENNKIGPVMSPSDQKISKAESVNKDISTKVQGNNPR
ncbi:MAG TPA: hypothetical protein VHO66_00675 [Ruminiclostridium sp.]|nr:hypothetical protein [Ruminiclostridium sp.]